MKIVRKHKEVLEPDFIGAEAGFILSIGNCPQDIKIREKESMAWVPQMGIWNLQDKAIEVGHIFVNGKGEDFTSSGAFGAKLKERDFLRILFRPSSPKCADSNSKGLSEVLYTFRDSFILEDGKKEDISSILIKTPSLLYFSSSNRLYTSHLRKGDLLNHIGLYLRGCETIGYDCAHSGTQGLYPTKTGKFDKKFEDIRDFVYKLKPKLEERFNIKF